MVLQVIVWYCKGFQILNRMIKQYENGKRNSGLYLAGLTSWKKKGERIMLLFLDCRKGEMSNTLIQ
jgi:hypothetical protein